MSAANDDLDLSAAAGGTAALAEFGASVEFSQLSDDVLNAFERCLIDFVGCTVYGSTLEWSRLLRDYAADEGPGGTVPVLGTSARSTAVHAALANGTSAHAFELDDLHEASCIHPAAVVFPAALAVAPDGATGADFVAAVVAGYEVGIRVGEALGIAHFLRGFHPQGTVGVFAAAAAASRMLGLDAERTRHALAIAASQGAGLMSAQSGGMVKRFHSGRAAQSGVIAALLASRGMTGTQDPIEAGFGGFLSSLRGSTLDPGAVSRGLGERWGITEVGFKPYASCAVIHPAIALQQQILSELAADGDAVEQVEVVVATDAHVHCGFTVETYDTINAQMSFGFAMAAAAVHSETGGAAFEPHRLTDQRVLDFAQRVVARPSEEFDALGERYRFATEVIVTLKDGRTGTAKTLYRPGSADLPLSDSQLRDKYFELLRAEPRLDADRLLTAIEAVPHAADLEQLVSLLTLEDVK